MITTLILSLVPMLAMFSMIWAAVALVRDKRFFTTAPKDVQAAITKQNDAKSSGIAFLGYVVLIVCVISFIGAFIYAGWDGIQQGFGFWGFFVRFLVMLYLMQAFDMICLDWLLLTKSRFFQHYYPEIEGCAGLSGYGFNLKEQICKIIAFPFVSLLLAGICFLIG